MNIFYQENIDESLCLLNEDEAKHALKVLRLKPGSIIFLVDGVGGFYKAELLNDIVKNCQLRILEKKSDYNKTNYFLHMAVAPTKSIDRFEWFLEKSTEIGIHKITPLISRYSERKQIKYEREKKVITAAMKQSLKAYHPKLDEITGFKDFLMRDFSGKKFIAHCNSDGLPALKKHVNQADDVLILIGPEGDFSQDEVELALKNGFIEVSLGNSRLRTETAAVVACYTVALINS